MSSRRGCGLGSPVAGPAPSPRRRRRRRPRAGAGRRMSSACTRVSPSDESTGPGGPLLRFCACRNRASVAAGPPAVSASMLRRAIVSNRKPARAHPAEEPERVILAVAVMWPSTSCTDQPVHSDGSRHGAAAGYVIIRCITYQPVASGARRREATRVVRRSGVEEVPLAAEHPAQGGEFSVHEAAARNRPKGRCSPCRSARR